MADVFSRFGRSLELIRASASVLRSDRELLVLPVLSILATVVVAGAFVGLAVGTGAFADLQQSANGVPPPSFYVWLFVFYFLQYFVIIFFNTALVGAAIARLQGGDPTVSSALALAVSRIVPIVGYALISATVGMVLRAIAERFGFIGRIIEGVFGLAWTIATFLVVPVLAAEGVGPFKAIERSTALLGETWGENLIGNGGISVVTSFCGVVIAVIGFGGGVMLIENGSMDLGVVLLAISFILFMALILVAGALSGIYAGAVYYYARTGDAPNGFDKTLIRGAFSPKS